MKIKRVLITSDTAWELIMPSWYAPGRKHFVKEHRDPHNKLLWIHLDYNGIIHQDDAVELTDPWSRFLCALKEIQVHAGAAASEYIKPIAEVLRKWTK